MNAVSVTIYSADWCGFCHAAKQYLADKGMKFTEKNMEQNPEYIQEAVKKSGQMGIPVLDIDGKIVIGFDRPTIDRLIQEENLTS